MRKKILHRHKMPQQLPAHVASKIVALPRKHYHHLMHKVRTKYGIGKRTLFYMKEYGPKSHVSHVIIKESIKILLIASLLSSIGGFYLEGFKHQVAALLPLLILIPALTDMIGDYATIVSSKFTTMLYLGKVRPKGWWKEKPLHAMLRMILTAAIVSAFYIGTLAYVFSLTQGFHFEFFSFIKIVQIAVVAALALTILVFFISVVLGFWIYSKNEDPNNFLIPITTAIADFGTIVMLILLVRVFFGV
jgi:mgtE-like transporter